MVGEVGVKVLVEVVVVVMDEMVCGWDWFVW